MTRRKQWFFRGDIACLLVSVLLVQAAAAGPATPTGEPSGRAAQQAASPPPRIIGVIIGDGPALILESHGAEPIQTVEVFDVMRGLPAAEAGIEPGDLIISIEGEPPGDAVSLGDRLRALAEGESVRLVILREQRVLVFDTVPAEAPDDLRLQVPAQPQEPVQPQSRAAAFEDVLAELSSLHAGLWVDSDDFKTETIVAAITALTEVQTAATILHLLDALPPERAKASREEILREATTRLHEAGARLGIMSHDPALPHTRRGSIQRTRDAIGVFRRLADVDPKQTDPARYWRTRQLVDSFIYDNQDAGAGSITAAIGLREQEQFDRAPFGSDQHRRDFFESLQEQWLGMEWEEAELWRRLVEGDPADPTPADPDNE